MSMKLSDATNKWKNGARVLPVTFMKSKADRIKWRDKESRAMMEAPILAHTVATEDGDMMIINERVPDTFKEGDYKSPFTKGSKCILEYTTIYEERGVLQARGQIHVIDPETPASK